MLKAEIAMVQEMIDAGIKKAKREILAEIAKPSPAATTAKKTTTTKAKGKK